eukprot:CAMPEP_0170467010 /NCGR_PEP_ID=MMETSP0123-20130129/10751_1 /TAXON_ID=182087 /ORGANISM="Favella ehrenbergii, Strain Fehren 1" /LENGTH=112 /DNA_ID=CAMNT_0010733273 /DNA_START=1235 /DNA_END=1575 /DNA_ORIENTATION=-
MKRNEWEKKQKKKRADDMLDRQFLQSKKNDKLQSVKGRQEENNGSARNSMTLSSSATWAGATPPLKAKLSFGKSIYAKRVEFAAQAVVAAEFAKAQELAEGVQGDSDRQVGA